MEEPVTPSVIESGTEQTTSDINSNLNPPKVESDPGTDQILPQQEDIAKQYVCDVCFVGNLTHSVNVKRCNQCNELHCTHFTSKIDPQYCIHCMHDVQVTTETVSKITTTYDEVKDEIKVRTRKAKQIKFTGLHWIFEQRKINDYTDAELDLAIEYHSATYKALLYEREQRRVDAIQKKYKASAFVVPTSTTASSVTESTTVRKSKVIKSTKPNSAEINLAAALQTLMQAGITAEDLMKKVKK